MPHIPPRNTNIGSWQMFGAVVVSILVSSLTLYVLTSYSIKAYSDPLNWINAANNIGTMTRWPIGYPAFLWLALKIAGPHYIFLSNLPVLALVAVLLSLLTRAAVAETDSIGKTYLVGLGAMAIFLGMDPENLLYLVNPYRDPLSYVLLLLSALMFVVYLRGSGKTVLLVCLSGLMTGLAYCVKETSIVFAAPLFILGLSFWYSDRRIRFWKSCVLFAVFLLLGCLPIVIQAYMTTGEVATGPTTVFENNLFPGFYPPNFFTNLYKAGIYYRHTVGWFYVTGFLLGCIYAFKSRNRTLLFLLLSSVLLFGTFYGLYHRFVVRYFTIVSLFAAPIVAYGIYSVLGSVVHFARKSSFMNRAHVAVTVMLVFWTVLSLRPSASLATNFQVPQARQFKHDLEVIVPEGSMIYCSRVMCDVIGYLSHADSRPAEYLVGPELNSDANVQARVKTAIRDGRPMYCLDIPYDQDKTVGYFLFGRWIEVPHDQDQGVGYYLLRRYFDLTEILSFPSSKYNLDAQNPNRKLTLFKIGPWSRTVTTHQLQLPDGPGAILQIDVGTLWRGDTNRTYAKLYFGETMLDDHVDDGINYYAIDRSDSSLPLELSLKSDKNVPSSIYPLHISSRGRLDLDFGIHSPHLNDSLLSADVLALPVKDPYTRMLVGTGSVRLPVPWSTHGLLLAEVRARPYSEKGREPGHFVSVTIPVKHDTSSPFTSLDLGTKSPVFATGVLPAPSVERPIELDRIVLHNVRLGASAFIDVGEQGDSPFLVQGFYHREAVSGPELSARWTAGRAVVQVYLKKPTQNLKLTLKYWDRIRPRDDPDNLKILFNGKELYLTKIPASSQETPARVEARILMSSVREERNLLELVATPWVPVMYSKISSDGRELGIFLDSISLQPAE